MESVISAALIVLVIRSRRPFFKSLPGRYLAIATGTIAALALILPFTPLAVLFGFKVLPAQFFLMLLMIIISYIVSAELAKRFFYKMVKF
jgi:Mg2+-importing ATPase